jgi:hypothetical protein
MRKSRAPDLTPVTVGVVLDLLDGWNAKLTWELLIAKVAEVTGFEYSRFTFAEYPRIADAFAVRKRSLSGALSREPQTPRDRQIVAALDKAKRAEERAARLERENDLLLEQFATWAANAERYGVTIDKLNAPLSKPARERSRVE